MSSRRRASPTALAPAASSQAEPAATPPAELSTLPRSIGEQLKRARLSRKLSMSEVTRATKIQPWVLEALEQNRLHDGMNVVYVRAFLTNYAKFLQLDAPALVSELMTMLAPPPPPEAPVSEPPSASPSPAPAAEPTPARPSLNWSLPRWSWEFEIPWPLVRRIGMAAASVAAVILVVKFDPLQRLMTRAPRQEASLTVIEKKPIAPTEAMLALEPTQSLELAIVAQRSTWVSVKADGHLLAQQQLKSGSKEIWKARKRFELIVAKPTQVEVLLNGQSIHPLAMAHQGRLLITHQSIKPLPEASE